MKTITFRNIVAGTLLLIFLCAFQSTALATAPSATTQAASSITTSSAQLNSYVNPNGLATTIYFQYGLTTSYGSSTSLGGIGTTAGNYGFSISSLSANTTYHFRIVAYNSSGTTYGSDLTFTTLANPPSATTQAASSITTSSAQLNSYVNPNGASTTIYYQYGLTSSYGSTTISGNIGTSAGNYGTSISSLSPNTTYHFRIVAYNSGGTSYGSDLTFTTLASAPTATTQAASSIASTSAQLNSYVNPNGASTTIYYQYGLTASYGSTTISGNIGTSAGNYGTTASSLTPNTTYHFRIVAYNSGGTSYGSDLTFTTLASAPAATTQAATSITSTSAQLNSYVDPSGATTTIYYQYGLTTSYGSTTISGNIGTTAGNYGTTASSLSPNTTYHFRIVASSSGGTTYGSDLTFTTLANAPTATTQAATLITSSSAQLNSYVNPNGVSTTIFYQYGLNTSYGSTSISGNIGTTAGNYGTTVSSLSPNTTYHFQIVAYSSGGTNYGGDLTFTTTALAQAPTVSTLTASNVTSVSAQLNASLNPNGSTTTAYFEYGTTTSYGSSSSVGNFGTVSQTISYTISSLSPGTTYHYRLTASNSNGTTHGNDQTFTTTGTSSPTAQTLDATSVTTSTAQLNGSLNPNGISTTAYFEYGLTAAYGSSTASGNFGTTSQNIGYTISGLVPNTTYHFRLDASNTSGPSYGVDKTFTTLPTTTTAQNAWVSGTGGIGLRLRDAPSLSGNILLVMPEGAEVTLLSGTQSANGYLWRNVTYNSQTGWADSEYLVFSPTGTPTPPAAPVSLRQLQSDDISPIAAGGTATSSSVILAATTPGTSSQQFSVQVEVRPTGTAFSDPTATSPAVPGGTEAQITVISLANQGYHWRARVLDGNGVPSSWVSFSGNATDFTVNATYPPTSLFTWSPAQIFVGDSVTFSADTTGTGFTYSWNYGDTQTGSGVTVNHSFSQTGSMNVTLTVTDAHGNQSQHSETITVLSMALVNEINNLAQQTEGLLDQVTLQAQDAAVAADYFQQGVGSAEMDSAHNLFFDALSAGMPLANLKDLLQTSLPEVSLSLGGDALLMAASHVLSVEHTGYGYPDIFVPGISTFVTQKKAEIEQLRQQAIIAAGSLSQAQSDALVRTLQAQWKGNVALSVDYSSKVNFPLTVSQMKSTIGDGWSWVSVAGLGVDLLTDGASSSVAFLVSESSVVAQSTLDQLTILSGQSTDCQMLVYSLGAVGQATYTAKRMSDNVESGLNAVISGQAITAPMGTLTVQYYAPGYLQQFAFGSQWITTAAYASVTVQNTGTVPATFRVESAYPETLTTSQLGLPFNVPGFNYTVTLLMVDDGILLNPGDQKTITDYYVKVPGGQIPQGAITYTLTAKASTNYYLIALQSGKFGTTLVDTNGNQIDHSQMPDVTLAAAPVQSSLVQYGDGFSKLNLNVRNTFGAQVLLNVQQQLPVGTVVVDAGGASVGSNQLTWELNLQPGDSQFYSVTLKLPTPVGQPPLSNTVVSVYDTVNTNWLQFQQAQVSVQLASTPQPQINLTGFSSGSFGMDLTTLVPGVYRVDATTNFINWNTIFTTTNTSGAVHVSDPAAKNIPAQFYRGVRLQ